MNVVKCNNGHFFDGDSYQLCPHCGEGISTVNENNIPNKQDKFKKKGFPWKKSKESLSDTPATGSSLESFGTYPSQHHDEPKLIEEPKPLSSSKNDEKTIDFWKLPIDEEKVEDEKEENNDNPVKGIVKTELIEPDEPVNKKTSLIDQVKKVSANNEGKTVSYFNAANESNKQNTINEQSDPVVGWLVCVCGNHFGESFYIVTGKNSIGRNDDNSIVINKDKSISRVKHALIVYEPKKRQFYLQPGDSRGLTYLNEEYIIESTLLKEKDIIEIGDSEFMFIPLCGDSFSWENYMNKE